MSPHSPINERGIHCQVRVKSRLDELRTQYYNVVDGLFVIFQARNWSVHGAHVSIVVSVHSATGEVIQQLPRQTRAAVPGLDCSQR